MQKMINLKSERIEKSTFGRGHTIYSEICAERAFRKTELIGMRKLAPIFKYCRVSSEKEI